MMGKGAKAGVALAVGGSRGCGSGRSGACPDQGAQRQIGADADAVRLGDGAAEVHHAAGQDHRGGQDQAQRVDRAAGDGARGHPCRPPVGLRPAVRAARGAARQLPDADAPRGSQGQVDRSADAVHQPAAPVHRDDADRQGPLVEKDGDKQVVVQEGKPAKTGTCSDTERKKVQEQIMAFVSTNPAPAAPAAAPQPGRADPADPASQKGPASQKK